MARVIYTAVLLGYMFRVLIDLEHELQIVIGFKIAWGTPYAPWSCGVYVLMFTFLFTGKVTPKMLKNRMEIREGVFHTEYPEKNRGEE